jgi:hypothetical protein
MNHTNVPLGSILLTGLFSAYAQANAWAYTESNPVTRIDPCGTEDTCPAEVTYCRSNLLACGRVLAASYTAIRETERIFRLPYGGPRPDGTRSNAFQHCLWMALTARAVGASSALQYGQRHESCRKNDADKVMDLRNNQVGVAIGSRNGYLSTYRTACLNALKHIGFRLTWIR